MSGASRLSRRVVLGTAAALSTAACTGRSTAPADPVTATDPADPAKDPALDPKEHAILDLQLTIEQRFRPFALVSPAFTEIAESAPQELSGISTSAGSPAAPFAAVEVDVTAADAAVVAGLVADEGAHLLAFHDPDRAVVGVEVRRDGTDHVVAETSADLPPSFGLAFVLNENRVVVLVDTGDGWQPLIAAREEVSVLVDMRVPDTLRRHRYAWGTRPGDGAVRTSGVRAGLFGMAGIRDQHLVQHADGTPYVRDGKVFFTATCAGLGFFQQAHWGVFSLDPGDPRRFEQVAQLYSHRDGLLLGDHAGQVVRDDENDRWIVATSSWGDFDFTGVHVRHTTTEDDVLRGVHVLETERCELPTEVSAWDPGITRIDGRWHVSFVESPSQDPFDFHPALAAGPRNGTGKGAGNGAGWHESLELVGAATDLHQCEGPILAQVEGRWWLLASDGDHRVYPVFDLDMKRVGELDAPYETNIPHPQLVPHRGGRLLVTFDGTQYAEDLLGYGTHGDVLVMRQTG